MASKPSPRGVTRAPSLVFVNGPHAGESVPLLPTTLTIGREHDNNVELKDPDVARYHARIVHERGSYVVEDLDSTTGTWVNGQRTKRSPLNHGDVVRVGTTEIAIDFEWASSDSV
jgi:pSer/pThr/pTyr-binding forkhead associated (FHA) protein